MAPIYGDDCQRCCSFISDWVKANKRTIKVTVQIVGLCLAISYVVSGIVFLQKDFNKCGRFSHFWTYCLVCLFATPLSYLISVHAFHIPHNHEDSEEEVVLKPVQHEPVDGFLLLLLVFLLIPMIAYGRHQLFAPPPDGPCEPMKQSGLYVFGYVNFVWYCVFLGMSLIAGAVVYCSESEKKKDMARMDVSNNVSSFA